VNPDEVLDRGGKLTKKQADKFVELMIDDRDRPFHWTCTRCGATWGYLEDVTCTCHAPRYAIVEGKEGG
jgi:hypothetical protein